MQVAAGALALIASEVRRGSTSPLPKSFPLDISHAHACDFRPYVQSDDLLHKIISPLLAVKTICLQGGFIDWNERPQLRHVMSGHSWPLKKDNVLRKLAFRGMRDRESLSRVHAPLGAWDN